MILYRFGEITWINSNNLILESYGNGYIVTVPNISRFEQGQKVKLYFYEYRNEYMQYSYGFKDFKERLLFMDLISIDKIGPKIAISLLDKGWENIANLIANDDWQSLSGFNYISERTAKLIIVELKTKWAKMLNKMTSTKASSKRNETIDSIARSLENIGFSKNEIDGALSNVDWNLPDEEILSNSITWITQNRHTKGINV
ncbi:Holliday junction branch migration protein RuvA [Mycoplasma corogypsi]|uniref:Holliday junction branch migration protein RuvA n=1 Tax=Mycoplasma corogypsi TaxID=2106 RepID=UPI0038733982